MSDVFQEVEEEYRREQMAKFWEKYRLAVVGGVAALVVGVAGFQGWTYWHARQIETSSRGIDSAATLLATPGQEKEAADILAKVAATGSGGYPLVAKLQEAALRAEVGDRKAAVTLYDAIAADGSGGALFSDYATLRAALLLCETAPFEDVKKRLEPVASGDGPWHLQAREILAYTAWRAGKKDDALKLYAEVQAGPAVTAGTKRRALEMSALIKVGMKPADVKLPAGARLPGLPEPLLPLPKTPTGPGDTNSLLGPSAPTDPSSLLGPNPTPPNSP